MSVPAAAANISRLAASHDPAGSGEPEHGLVRSLPSGCVVEEHPGEGGTLGG